MYPTDDRTVLAYYDFRGEPHVIVYDFKKAPPGSHERAQLVDPFERHVEALKGQGTQVHIWDIEHWPMYREAFLSGRLRRKK